MTPDLTEQAVYTITPGTERAFRLAVDDGRTFHELDQFDTAQEAQVARGAAILAARQLAAIFKTQGMAT